MRKNLIIEGIWNSFYKNSKNDDWIDSSKLLLKGLNPKKFISDKISLNGLPKKIKQIYQHKKGIKKNKHIKSIVIF